MKRLRYHALRLALLVFLAALGLQAYFALRIGLMTQINPSSTAFQRSEAWRLLRHTGQVRWLQEWIDYDRLPDTLKRAVLASEDSAFVDHAGIEWDAIERAWDRNQRAEARAPAKAVAGSRGGVKLVGGSTISQQLAKNLFLSSERTFLRKGQEFLVTLMLEATLSKERILECYLNSVEWGEGVFGAEAAARHYYRGPAENLGPQAAARLAVMLPAPKRFEKRPDSPYLQGRSSAILARMSAVELP